METSAALKLTANASDQLSDRSLRSDEELIESFRDSGDHAFFEAVVRRYERELFSFLRRYLGQHQLAEDAFQATFITVHQNLDKYEAGRRFRPWLYTVATNKAIDLKRQAKRRPAFSLDSTWNASQDADFSGPAMAVESRETDPFQGAMDSETRRNVRDVVGQLSEQTQLLIELVFYRNLKYSEVGEILGVPIGTVKSRVFNALRKLNAVWRRKFEDTPPLSTS
jgi:RNA polymerase sigma-70 factor (ECF subfamily)